MRFGALLLAAILLGAADVPRPGTASGPMPDPCPREWEGREWCVGCRSLAVAVMHCRDGHFGFTRLCHAPQPGDLCFGPAAPRQPQRP